MVKEISREGEIVFACEECGFLFRETGKAEECEDFCREHHGCNLEIAKHSIGSV